MNWKSGRTWQNRVKFVAIFQIIGSSVYVLILSCLLVLEIISFEKNNPVTRRASWESQENSALQNSTFLSSLFDHDEQRSSLGQVIGIAIFILVIFLFIDWELLKAANQRNVGKCRIWRTVRCIRLTFAIIIFITGFYKVRMQQLQGVVLAEIVVDLCCIFVVQKFIRELKCEECEEGDIRSSVSQAAAITVQDNFYEEKKIKEKQRPAKHVTIVE
ncbi:uncharacterized protein LOC110862116 [Folsomia candida]|uniref:uncharacterized protein LOC110862116 n=1 Tax=Folsomia candida TaxID=158441 RepID=UPI000B8F160E|nr:uncharacterized protein LOC110862116 [Folsomia candida]